MLDKLTSMPKKNLDFMLKEYVVGSSLDRKDQDFEALLSERMLEDGQKLE